MHPGDGLPEARRAHAGVILDVDGASTLVVHGGRNKEGDLLADVWATSLDADEAEWRCLSGCEPPADSSTDASLGRKHKKKIKNDAPSERKGHVAVAIPDDVHPKMVRAYRGPLVVGHQQLNNWSTTAAMHQRNHGNRDGILDS